MSDHQRLFSYGTLRQAEVQLATFGRRLDGAEDVLPGYRLDVLTISNPEVVGVSGIEQHPVATPTGSQSDRVPGMVFEVTAEELASADAYEDADYRRIQVTLASGLQAWLYVAR
jgi:gamma-glutamylcyclotransferase (GGCT)/AIG2-like uncharacterized protein YtfP